MYVLGFPIQNEWIKREYIRKEKSVDTPVLAKVVDVMATCLFESGQH